MPARLRAVLRRALGGVAVAILILLGVELFWWWRAGPPPLPRALIRVSATEIVIDGATATLHHPKLPQQDTSVPATPGERPRVVFLGESSVRQSHATPPDMNFPFHVQARLPDVEVVNFGAPGQSVAGILRLCASLAPLEPDLVVIYTGHNEFNQPVFAGEVDGVRIGLLPLYRLMGLSWIRAQLAAALLPPQVGAAGVGLLDPNTRAPLIPTSDDQLLRLREYTLLRFRNELGAAVDAAPAPVLLVTQLRNFDDAPQGVLVASRPACGAAMAQAPTARPDEPGRWAEAAAAACGDDAAITWWYRAHAALRAGDTTAAGVAWGRSLDADPLPLRAPRQADAIVRAVAKEHGAALVDLAARFPFAEDALFTDTLHPSPAGARAIATELAPEIQAALGR